MSSSYLSGMESEHECFAGEDMCRSEYGRHTIGIGGIWTVPARKDNCQCG